MTTNDRYDEPMELFDFLWWLRGLGVTGEVGKKFLGAYLAIEDSLPTKPNDLGSWIVTFEAWADTIIGGSNNVK